MPTVSLSSAGVCQPRLPRLLAYTVQEAGEVDEVADLVVVTGEEEVASVEAEEAQTHSVAAAASVVTSEVVTVAATAATVVVSAANEEVARADMAVIDEEAEVTVVTEALAATGEVVVTEEASAATGHQGESRVWNSKRLLDLCLRI